MLWVLVASVLASVLAVAAVWLWLAGDLAGSQQSSTPTASQAARFHTTPQPSS